jgi:hypothetical protein
MKFQYLRNIKNNEKIKNELINIIRNEWKESSSNEIIKNINNLFVLYFEEKEIIELKDKISEERYNYLINNNLGTIGSYILFLDKSPRQIKLIDYCDSTIPKMNLLFKLIDKYHKRYKKIKYIIPNFSIYSARIYWTKYFISIYQINNIEELESFLKENKLELLNYSFIKHAFIENNNIEENK